MSNQDYRPSRRNRRRNYHHNTAHQPNHRTHTLLIVSVALAALIGILIGTVSTYGLGAGFGTTDLPKEHGTDSYPIATETLPATIFTETATPVPDLLSFHNTTNARWLVWHHPEIADRILERPWIQDGVSDEEKRLLDELLNTEDVDLLAQIADMPFLDTAEDIDSLVVGAMNGLSHDEALQHVLDHPRIQQTSDDTWSSLVIAAHAIRGAGEEQVSLLLDAATLEHGAIETPYSPELKVSIVRTHERRQETIELVFNAVSLVENLMNMPLPVSHIVIVADERAVPENSGGANWGYAMSFSPEREDPSDSWDWNRLELALVHEVAHYFWNGAEAWVDEGMAKVFEYVHKRNQGVSQSQLKPLRRKCAAQDIEQLVQWGVETSDEQHLCNHYMGETIFVALMNEVGRDSFFERMGRVYPLIARKDSPKVGIKDIRREFSNQVEIVERFWSGKWNTVDTTNKEQS